MRSRLSEQTGRCTCLNEDANLGNNAEGGVPEALWARRVLTILCTETRNPGAEQRVNVKTTARKKLVIVVVVVAVAVRVVSLMWL